MNIVWGHLLFHVWANDSPHQSIHVAWVVFFHVQLEVTTRFDKHVMRMYHALPSIHLNVTTLNSTENLKFATLTASKLKHVAKPTTFFKVEIIRVGFETSNVHITGGITRGRCKYTTWNSKLLKEFGGSYYSHHYSDCPPERHAGRPGEGNGPWPSMEGGIQWMYTRSTADEIEGEGAFIEAAPNPCVPRRKVSIFFQFKNNRY